MRQELIGKHVNDSRAVISSNNRILTATEIMHMQQFTSYPVKCINKYLMTKHKSKFYVIHGNNLLFKDRKKLFSFFNKHSDYQKKSDFWRCCLEITSFSS